MIETQTFGPGVVDQVLNGSNYARSFKGFTMIAEAPQRLQIQEFMKGMSTDDYNSEIVGFDVLKDCIVDESLDEARSLFEKLTMNHRKFKTDFEDFIKNKML